MGPRGVTLSLAALAACGSENTDLRVRVDPQMWTSRDDCSHGELEIYVHTDSGATVRIPGVVEEKVVGDSWRISLPGDKIADRTSLTITAELDGRKGEATFEIPKPPPRRGKIEGERAKNQDHVMSCSAKVTYRGEGPGPLELRVDGVLDADMLRFTYAGCLLASGTASVGTIEVRSPTELVHRVPLDVAIEKAGARGKYGGRPLSFNLRTTNTDGTTAEIPLDCSLALDTIERRRFNANRTGTGLASAPAYEPGKQQPYAQFVDSEQPIVMRGARELVVAVAWSQNTNTRPAEGCGPYQKPGGWEKFYIGREVFDEKVTIRATRTGDVIAEKTFKGVVPPCPATMTKGGVLETTKVGGGANKKAMLAWVEATVK